MHFHQLFKLLSSSLLFWSLWQSFITACTGLPGKWCPHIVLMSNKNQLVTVYTSHETAPQRKEKEAKINLENTIAISLLSLPVYPDQTCMWLFAKWTIKTKLNRRQVWQCNLKRLIKSLQDSKITSIKTYSIRYL